MLTHREQLIALNLVPATPALRRRLVDALGSWEAVWAAGLAELRGVGLDLSAAQRFVDARAKAQPADELERARQAGIALITLADPAYPETLRTLVDPPPVVYVRGTVTDADRCAVALVGARHASPYGLECAQRLAGELADCGVTVVSGLARGIDAAAHQGALRAGGRTLAVLGSGLDRLYPPEHAELAAEIAGHGALVSEFPLGTAPLAMHFPRRNRIISGLAQGVVIVEAGRRSGALITADCALEQGREVFAVPGPMTALTSQGTHALLKQGARLVTGVHDILHELGIEPAAAPARADHRAAPASSGTTVLEGSEQRVIAVISAREPRDIDTIAEASALASAEVSAALVRLELKRLVRRLPGQQFLRG